MIITIDAKIKERFANIARSETFAHILDQYGLRNKRTLDIGCSYGEFLTHFGRGSVGLTVMEDEARYGVEVGLDIRFGNIESAEMPIAAHERFEAVFANNILEHMYAPYGFLVRLRDFLAHDGFAIIGVPCIPAIASLVNLRKFRGSLAKSHINFFTNGTLKKTVERAGWRVHTVRSFHVASPALDRLLDPISPHFYVVATPDPSFVSDKNRTFKLNAHTC